jgi:uncharacterized membrane protein
MGSVTKSVVVNAPVSQVFNFWRNFENFPRFMENIESIQSTGEDLSHWKSKGPLGTTVEWDAKTTSVQENKKIAWQSTEGHHRDARRRNVRRSGRRSDQSHL